LSEAARLEAATKTDDNDANIRTVREEALHLLQGVAAHRQRGADLIYEAYSVDLEGGESG
jgi:hypothetical protein